MTEWSEWSSCEIIHCDTGNGLKYRYRNITQYPDNGRPTCGATVERQYCVDYTPCSNNN
ncbi:hypothetical protein BLA29_015088 [Euroglyphus maynei]|uniref:Spondin-like TSP1 domain-containing protein n=1 Tax=Euroglyphus maynei TaxID=6958 RepID=A0A1Y3AVM9_EURMA|nr:hypothetical protein BLA29_015088 [Euroglyphus maynei]